MTLATGPQSQVQVVPCSLVGRCLPPQPKSMQKPHALEASNTTETTPRDRDTKKQGRPSGPDRDGENDTPLESPWGKPRGETDGGRFLLGRPQ